MSAKVLEVTVEVASKSDIPGILSVENECFLKPWSEKIFLETIGNMDTLFLKATVFCEIVGYIGIYFVENEGYVYNLAVKKNFRNLGIATKLLNNIINFCKKHRFNFLSLEVRKSNSAAIKLYTNRGFNIVGVRKNFYTNPVEDAYIMTTFFEV